LIRDLMLVRDLSTRGPEDTPKISMETALLDFGRDDRKTSWVTGRAAARPNAFAAELHILRPDQPGPIRVPVEENQFRPFIVQCAEAIARNLGSMVTEQTRALWAYGRPASVQNLVQLGRIVLGMYPEQNGSVAAASLWTSDRDFSVVTESVDEAPAPSLRAMLLEALRRDPYNAQLCFKLFLDVWDSTGPQPHAVQFTRRAIELSPGHGKSHMCAPHAATPGVNMLPHSDLGYRLLPGNCFAINNYIINLRNAGRAHSEILPLAIEGIDADPCDPGNYYRLMEIYEQTGDYRNALKVALSLQELFEPQMNERAFYCLCQNPRRSEQLRTGQYDPAADNRARIEWLRGKV
jgi:hypothetical protein